MKLDDKRVTEIFLGLILVIGLIILILLFTQSSSISSSNVQNTQPVYQPPQYIVNSYNTNSFNKIIHDDLPTTTYKKYYYKKHEYRDDDRGYINWSGREIKKGLFGNDIDKYFVYVKNTYDRGKYFKVKFDLKDCYEGGTSGSVTKYISPYDKEKFVYTDIKAKYCNWRYEIN